MNRRERRAAERDGRKVQPLEWLDYMKRTDRAAYEDAMHVLTSGAGWFENGRLVFRDGDRQRDGQYSLRIPA